MVRYCDNRIVSINRSMQYRHSTGQWRIGEPKSKSGYRTIPLTDEAIDILKKQKQKNANFKIIPLEWREFVFLCKKGTPVKKAHMIPCYLSCVKRLEYQNFLCMYYGIHLQPDV